MSISYTCYFHAKLIAFISLVSRIGTEGKSMIHPRQGTPVIDKACLLGIR